MLTYLQKLRNERDSLSATSSGILEKAADEDRTVTDVEKASVAKMAERCATIDEELTTFSAQYESQKRYADLRARIEDADDVPEHKELERRKPAELEPRGWGQLFVRSAEFSRYDGFGSMAPVSVPHSFERAPIDSSGIGGLPVPPYTYTVPGPTFPTALLDAVGHVSTNNSVVQWLVESGLYPDAAIVAEGALKPEANFTLDTETASLVTYAHHKGITRQALANIPMIQSIVENQLRGGIYQKLEKDVVQSLISATLTEVAQASATDGSAFLAAIRYAMGIVQGQGFPAGNTVLLNPADWAYLDVSVMHETTAGPVSPSGFWGLRPISSPGVPVGTAYVGDLKSGVTLFDRGQASVFMSDSHSDYFVRNILVILAEIEALPMVTQASALVRVTPYAGP